MPVATLGLPEEAQRRIPRAILACLKPAPVAGERQHNLGGNSECASQMGGGIIDGNYHIHRGHLGGETIDV